jgi:predicted TIM-barrel enzyme
MKVAIVDGDYRKTLENGTLDFIKTIEVIREAEKVLHNACQA